LRDGCEQGLILRAARPSEAQAIQLKNALEVSEEHLDLLAILARLLVSIGLGDTRATSRADSWTLRAILRIGVFGQQRAFSGQLAQSDWLAR
jgi:hypothetical protein